MLIQLFKVDLDQKYSLFLDWPDRELPHIPRTTQHLWRWLHCSRIGYKSLTWLGTCTECSLEWGALQRFESSKCLLKKHRNCFLPSQWCFSTPRVQVVSHISCPLARWGSAVPPPPCPSSWARPGTRAAASRGGGRGGLESSEWLQGTEQAPPDQCRDPAASQSYHWRCWEWPAAHGTGWGKSPTIAQSQVPKSQRNKIPSPSSFKNQISDFKLGLQWILNSQEPTDNLCM